MGSLSACRTCEAALDRSDIWEVECGGVGGDLEVFVDCPSAAARSTRSSRSPRSRR